MRSIRRVVLPLCLVAAALSASASTAGAAATSTVVVQGGTTISDSGLFANVVVPGFKKMFPQYKLQFVPVGTAVALCNAELGLGDAVWTHNPSAEQSFVNGAPITGCGGTQLPAGQSYSEEPFGRATMYSDFVVIGPTSDPAGVAANASNNAEQAFLDIANAGNGGTADFVSRGDGSGTNAKEATIWGLIPTPRPFPLGTLPPGVTSGVVPSAPWYHVSGVGQAANLEETNACPTSTFSSGACYTLADRGTFDYLQALGEVPNLTILSQTNPAPALGGPGLLNNLYHAYAVNPAAVSSTRPNDNLAGAEAFLTYVTSPQFQKAVANYPTASNPAFHPDAYAKIAPSTVFLPTYSYAGSPPGITLKGNISSVVPFSLPLAGAPVNVVRKTGTTTTPVASGTLNGSGNYAITFFPTHSGTYEIDFPQFNDLRETFFTLGPLAVTAGVTLETGTITGRKVSLNGTADPTTGRNNAKVKIQAQKSGKTGWRTLATISMGESQEQFNRSVTLPSGGSWTLRAQYTDSGVVTSGTSAGTPRAVLVVQVNGVQTVNVPLDCSRTPCDQPAVSNYPNERPSDPTGVVPIPAGFSAAQIATLAHAAPENVWEMQIENDPNPPLAGRYLDPANLYPPGQQFNPVFYASDSTVSAFREPPTDAADTDNARYTQVVSGKMTVNIITVNQLTVAATVDHTAAKVGEGLNFKVVVPPGAGGARTGETLQATWDFGDGDSARITLKGSVAGQQSATITHSFDTPGSYSPVTVTVSGDQGSGGSATIATRITIGKKAGNPGPGTHHSHTHKPPVSGSSHAKQTHPTPGTGNANTSSTQPTTSPPTTTSPPVTPPVVHKTLPQDPSLAGIPVSGVLLSAPVTEIAQAAAPSAAQGDGGTTSPSIGGGIPGAVGGVGLAVLLLVGGFLSEGFPAARWR